MIDISLTTDQLILLIFVMIYIVITSVAVSKFHKFLDEHRTMEAKKKLNLLSSEKYMANSNLNKEEILKLKKRSYLVLVMAGFFHSVICLYQGTNILYSGIPFLLFLFVLFGNYWLKGSQVAGFIKTRPGQSDYHG
jgi:hypothetical protein